MDDELLMISIEQLTAIATACLAAANSAWFFDDDEPEDQSFVDRNEGVRDQLAILQKLPSLFKVITNFTSVEFQELFELVCPLIVLMARSTGHVRGVGGRPLKLTSEHRLLHFILYRKHDNAVSFVANN